MKKFFVIVFLLFVVSVIHSQTFRLNRPAKDNVQTNGSYLFGEPRYQDPQNAHRGIDILMRWDTVKSSSAGMVHFVGYNPNDTIGGYEPNGAGNYITIKSQWQGRWIFLYYMHLQRPLVNINDIVLTGQPIAISGNTGRSTGPHLHFEIRLDYPQSTFRNTKNPELWCAISGMGSIYGNIPNAPNNTRVDIFPDPKPRPPYTTFSYALTYNLSDPFIGGDLIYNENYAIGDVKPGTYTIRALGGAYLRNVTVGPGQVVNADLPSSVSINSEIHSDFNLQQNYPNPFNNTTVISYSLSEEAFIQLKVFDLLGREITTIVDEFKLAGKHHQFFDANDLASGIYIYQLIVTTISGKVIIKNNKMTLIK